MTNSTNDQARALGWIISPPSASAYFTEKQNPVKRFYAKQGIGPDDEVGITAMGSLDDTLSVYGEGVEGNRSAPRTLPTTMVFAWNAVRCIAGGTHRPATPAEIEQMRVDQTRRAAECEAMTRLTQGQGTLRSTQAFAEASARVGTRKKGE